MSTSKWKNTQRHPIPNGDSVLCWDAINKVMFVAYRSGDDLIAEPAGKNPPCPYEADWWKPLPKPPR